MSGQQETPGGMPPGFTPLDPDAMELRAFWRAGGAMRRPPGLGAIGLTNVSWISSYPYREAEKAVAAWLSGLPVRGEEPVVVLTDAGTAARANWSAFRDAWEEALGYSDNAFIFPACAVPRGPGEGGWALSVVDGVFAYGERPGAEHS